MEEPRKGEVRSGAMILEHGSAAVAAFLYGTTLVPVRGEIPSSVRPVRR